jgi:hypothetical protein
MKIFMNSHLCYPSHAVAIALDAIIRGTGSGAGWTSQCAQGIETPNSRRALTPLISFVWRRIVYTPKLAV